MFRQQKHVLSKEEEAILADVSDMSADVSNIFSMFNNADIRFPSIEGKEGEKIPVSHGRYTLLLESRDVKDPEAMMEQMKKDEAIHVIDYKGILTFRLK